MQLPGSSRLAPVRELGASALDRRALAWAPPDPTSVLPWAPPTMSPIAMSPIASPALSPWPAPLGSLRFDLAPPVVAFTSFETVEPMHRVEAPDVAAMLRMKARERLIATRELPAIERSVATPPIESARALVEMPSIEAVRPGLPAPTLDQLVLSDVQARVGTTHRHEDRSGASARLLAAVIVCVGVWAGTAAAVFTLF